MNHADHVRLLRGGIEPLAGEGQFWADFGSGSGAFTLALADLLGPGATIYSVDQDRNALRTQARILVERFPQTTVHFVIADFTQPLDLPPLAGVVMANALHFQPPERQEAVVQQFKCYLRPGGRFILVEYNVDRGNLWVPHPLSYVTWAKLAHQIGFVETHLLATVPSHFLQEIYAAVSA
jgi:SAM-dependent methyltransferase